MKGTFHALPVADARTVLSLRLIRSGNGKVVLMSAPRPGERELLVSTLNGKGPERLEGVAASSPAWDAAAADDGSISFVFANSESATVWLAYDSTIEGRETMISRHYLGGYFGAPHFIKRDERGHAVSSVAQTKTYTGPVLFSREAGGEYGEFRKLPAPAAGELIDARLVRAADGFWLFMKFLPDSGPRRVTGELYCAQLRADLNETAPARRCLDGHEVLDFDADVSGGRAVIFATTQRGYILAEGPAFAAAEEVAQRPLHSPSVAIEGTTVHLAAIENAGTPDAKVLVGTVDGGR